MRLDIFNDLEAVPWSDLRHAFGPADDVPNLLRALVSDVYEDRREALYELMTTVWHQGMIYEVSAYVVPFLVNMLRSQSTPDRSMPALLLASIADGSSYLEVHAQPNTAGRETLPERLDREDQEFDQQLDRERDWVRTVREAVDPHLDLLYEFLVHEEPELRLAVALALGNYPGHATQSILMLDNAIANEDEGYVREAMEESKARLIAANGES